MLVEPWSSVRLAPSEHLVHAQLVFNTEGGSGTRLGREAGEGAKGDGELHW